MAEAAGRDALGPRFAVTALGEAMLRFSVGAGRSLASVDSLNLHVAGAELNVCAALSSFGRRTAWCSKLPDNPLGRLILHHARGWGVDTESVVLTSGGRVGTYYVEFAAPPLPARATYDRAHSAFCGLREDEVDWERLLDTRILHLTGVTPALAHALRPLYVGAIRRAREQGVLVSLDVNYRSKLWSRSEAGVFLKPLMRDVDLLICGRSDAGALFGLDSENEEELLDGLRAQTNSPHVVVTLGQKGSVAWSKGKLLRQPSIPVSIVDRIGAGDAFAAGVIDGLLAGNFEQGLATGTALATLALSKHGDVVTATREEVEPVLALLEESGTGIER